MPPRQSGRRMSSPARWSRSAIGAGNGRNGRAFAMPWCGRCPCRTVRARAGRGASAADSRARSGPAVRTGTPAPTAPFAVDVASSAADPDNPVSHTKIRAKPFYLNVAEIDPQKIYNPLSDFRFPYNGSSQPVQILTKRDLNGDGKRDNRVNVTAHWSINGGATR